jgi:hypothetical protein
MASVGRVGSVLSKGPNRVGVFLLWPIGGNRSSFRKVVF